MLLLKIVYILGITEDLTKAVTNSCLNQIFGLYMNIIGLSYSFCTFDISTLLDIKRSESILNAEAPSPEVHFIKKKPLKIA